MPMPASQARVLELAALGLPPNATANQINIRLRTVTPGTVIDNRTGLPYTHATAVDAGANQALGQIVGAAGLGLTLGEIAAGLSRLGGAVATGEVAGGSGAAGGAAATSTGGGAGAAAAGSATGTNVFRALKIGAAADFLSYIAWMFHPQTLLRLVEFLVGLILGAWGIYILTSSSRSGGRGTTAHRAHRIISMTPGPAGKLIRTTQGRRMGRREGQREAARMEARQSETRSARESSALERERINVNARQAARRY